MPSRASRPARGKVTSRVSRVTSLLSHRQRSLLKPQAGLSVGGRPLGQSTDPSLDVGLEPTSCQCRGAKRRLLTFSRSGVVTGRLWSGCQSGGWEQTVWRPRQVAGGRRSSRGFAPPAGQSGPVLTLLPRPHQPSSVKTSSGDEGASSATRQRLTVEPNVALLLQDPQQLAAVVGVSSLLEDVFQPSRIEQHGVVQVGGVRADLRVEEVQVSRGRPRGGLDGGSPQ